MTLAKLKKKFDIKEYLSNFSFDEKQDLFSIDSENKTKVEYFAIDRKVYPKFINEFWTSKQRLANSLHEIAYRACFKPQLPRFFIQLLTQKGDIVFDPFNGRGTTIIEAALLGRNIIANDVNPLSVILSSPRLFVPNIFELEKRLNKIPIDNNARADIDLSMFYHPGTEAEIVSLKNYLRERKVTKQEDNLDKWIRMLATNRLTGHSPGFFSVYTLPPNQAVSPESQIKINQKRNQKPEYRDTKKLICKKTYDLIKDVNEAVKILLAEIAQKAQFLNLDARLTNEIKSESVQLTVTSPPFLDVVQYAVDNWLRCWFNAIDVDEVAKKMTMSKTIDDWCRVMADVFKELYRITRKSGWVTFEVGEVRNGKIKLDEYIVPLGVRAGFECEGILINEQIFTKTANIWGIKNNEVGTNTNRIVIFHKG